MSPLCWVTGGGDQEKTTSLCPTCASNISGVPDGAVDAGNSNARGQHCHCNTICTMNLHSSEDHS